MEGTNKKYFNIMFFLIYLSYLRTANLLTSDNQYFINQIFNTVKLLFTNPLNGWWSYRRSPS